MSDGTPLRVLHSQAQQAIRAGNLPQALGLLQQAVAKTNPRESDYRPVLQDLQNVLMELNQPRHALTVAWYLADTTGERTLLERVPLADRARTYQAWAERKDSGQAEYAEAAKLYEEAGMVAHAAVCRELGGGYRAARALWSRLADTLMQGESDPYPTGLARFNIARCSALLDDPREARSATVGAVHLLEEAADRYERIGQRERAFDCYQVLIAVGKQSGEFEHVLEGYVNVVRILREDNLRYYALQSYESAISDADVAREYAAGATLAQEMAQYAQLEGMNYLANYAIDQQARMWRSVARSVSDRNGPVEMAENAVLAAIVALAKQEQFAAVGELYTLLSSFELDEARREHYARAATRYVGVNNEAVESGPLPAHLRQDEPFPEVWHVDLIEWEQRGSATMAAGDIILDELNWPDTTRRRAMAARLQALDIETQIGRQGRPPVDATVTLCRLLGHVQ
ncbi:MAG: HEAT repeat domain-containing protein, partial [Myxococcota bacterium]